MHFDTYMWEHALVTSKKCKLWAMKGSHLRRSRVATSLRLCFRCINQLPRLEMAHIQHSDTKLAAAICHAFATVSKTEASRGSGHPYMLLRSAHNRKDQTAIRTWKG